MARPGTADGDSEDLTEEELEEIYRMVDEEIERNGIPTDAELMAEIEKLNASTPNKTTDPGEELAKALGTPAGESPSFSERVFPRRQAGNPGQDALTRLATRAESRRRACRSIIPAAALPIPRPGPSAG